MQIGNDGPEQRVYFANLAARIRDTDTRFAARKCKERIKTTKLNTKLNISIEWSDAIKSSTDAKVIYNNELCSKENMTIEREAVLNELDKKLCYPAVKNGGTFRYIIKDGVIDFVALDRNGCVFDFSNEKEAEERGKADALNEFYSGIIKYANLYIRQSYSTYCVDPNSAEDMLQQAMTEFLTNAYRYTGSEALTTFSKRHLLHGAQQHISFLTGRTAYENEIANLVNRERNRLLALNYTEADANNISILREKLGDKLSSSQVEKALEIIENTRRESFNPDTQVVATFDTPEEEYLKNEKLAMIDAVLESLPEHERFLIEAITGGLTGKPVKYSDIGESEYFVNMCIRANLVTQLKYTPEGKPFFTKDVISAMFKQAQTHARRSPYAKEEVARIRKKLVKERQNFDTQTLHDIEDNQTLLFMNVS